MSDISEEIRKAFHTKVNVANVTNLVTGIHYQVAPEGSIYPYIIYNRMSLVAKYTFGKLAFEESIYLVKSLSDKKSSTTVSPIELNNQILSAVEIALGETLNLATKECLYIRRMSEIEMIEILSDRTVYHNGAMFKVFAQ